MFGKLLKYEWKAMMKTMLPIYGATMVLAERGIRTEVVLKADIRPGYTDMMHGKIKRMEEQIQKKEGKVL